MMEKQDHTHVIRMLADAYPKTFFIEPRRRVPLKVKIEQDITADLANNKDNELRFYNIEAAVDWYRSHIGYHMACGTPGNGRLDLTGRAIAKVTEAEARAAQQAVTEIHHQMRTSRNGNYFSPTPERAPSAPTLRFLTANSNLTNAEMFASIERHVKSLAAIVEGELIVDESLRANLARPVLQLIIDELKTVEARLG